MLENQPAPQEDDDGETCKTALHHDVPREGFTPPDPLLCHGNRALGFAFQVEDLSRGRSHQIVLLGELVQTRGAEQLGFLEFQAAVLFQQAPLFDAQCFQFVAGDGSGDGRRKGAGDQDGEHTGGADGVPAGSLRLRVGLANEARIVDALVIEEEVLVRQGTQLEGVAHRAHPVGPDRGVRIPRDSRVGFVLLEKCWQRRHGLLAYLRTPRGAQVISSARSLALRDAGLDALSSSVGCNGCLVRILTRPECPSALNFSFTARSSLDMKLIATIRPPLFSNSGPVSSNRPNSSGSSLTAMRSAMNVLVAGCKRPVLGTARSTTSARCSVLRKGRARTIALAIFRALLSSPN